MSQIQIRPMSPKDTERAAWMEQQIFSDPWSRQAFLDSLELKETLFLVAERSEDRGESGGVVGYAGMYISFDEAEITNVAVLPEQRGKGVGTAILQELFRRGAEKGVARYILEVRISNAAAIALYEKCGFEKAGVRKDFYRHPTEDAWIMIKES